MKSRNSPLLVVQTARITYPSLAVAVFCSGFIILLLQISTIYCQAPAAFSSFEYRGRDALRISHPLRRGEYLNPILPGMYPDPSIVRVKDDYYLVTSTFSWYPGVPIFHSRDLVHWRQIGFVLNRPGQLDLSHLQISQGIFAPTLRYHNGMFFMITTLVGGIGTFYVTAANPSGPWSDPVPIPELNGIDPSFFFDDDGNTYIVHNARSPGAALYDEQRVIWLVPFDPASGKISGERVLLVDGGPSIEEKPRWIEGPHLYKHNGYYYLLTALGGTSFDHSEIVFRSRSIRGPYLADPDNPVLSQQNLQNDRPDPVDATGHVDMVETQKGDWWAVFLGVRPYAPALYNTGRETFLLPVIWKNDWPAILDHGVPVPPVGRRPDLPASRDADSGPTGSIRWIDRFDEKSLRLPWQTLRTPETPCWNVDAIHHLLLLQPSKDDLISRGKPCLLARRQQNNDFSASISLRLTYSGRPVDAGLVLFQNEHSYYFLGVNKSSSNQCTVFLERGTGSIEAPAQIRMIATALKRCDDKVRLKVDGHGPTASFSFREASGIWRSLLSSVDATVLSTTKAGGFVGTFVGPFARLPAGAEQ